MGKRTFIVLAALFGAAPSGFAALPQSAYEQGVNPWGDPWAAKQPSAPDVPVAFATCYAGASLTAEEISFLTKLNSPFVFFDQCPPLSMEDPNALKYRTISDQIHAANPQLKTIGYHSVTTTAQGGVSQWPEAWYLHRRGMPATSANRISRDGYFFADITNPQFQDFVAAYIAQEMDLLHVDGIINDFAGFDSPSAMCDCNDVPDTVTHDWQSATVTLFTKIRQAIGPNRYHFINGFHAGIPALSNMTYFNAVLPYVDGVWFENASAISYFGTITSASAEFASIGQLLTAAASQDKRVFFVMNPGDISGYAVTNAAIQRDLERFFVSFYLNFFSGTRTPLIYYSPLSWIDSFGGEPYYKDWDLRLGQPSGSAVEMAPGVFRRVFARGEVWWNSSGTNYPISFNSRHYTADAVPVTAYMLGAKSGMMFLSAPTNDAEFISQGTLPNRMTAGQSQAFQITLRNSGSTSWITTPNPETSYFIVDHQWAENSANVVWSITGTGLPFSPVAPGQNATFSLTVTAPQTPGTYPLALQMMQYGIEFFGNVSPVQMIQVDPGLSPPPLAAPDLTSINGHAFPRSASLTFSYTGGVSAFTWEITPSGAPNGTPNAGALQNISPAPVVTATPRLNLAPLSLIPGSYTLRVQAALGNQQSPWATATFSVVNDELTGFRAYPNPWRADRGDIEQITFDRLPANSKIKIFTVSGRFVMDLAAANGSATWDLKNRSGEAVAAGIYIYAIDAGSTGKARGQLTLIR